MKLRLFGCAAAYVLAGTLCASAQDAPETKMKEGPSEAAPKAEGRGSADAPQMKDSRQSERAKGGSDRDGGKADRADRQAGQKESGGRENKSSDDTPQKTKGAAADKPDSDRSKGTSNAASEGNRERGAKSTEREGAGDAGRSAATKKDSDTPEGKGNRGGQASDSTTKAGKNVQLSADKRDRVQSSFRSELNLKRETKVDVNISIGSRAPRTWAFAPVPATVIELVPEYRGYVVAYVEDEYVICDPDTYEIVALLPASGGDDLATTGRSSGESGADQCSASITLSESDREAILTEVEMSDEIDASGVTVGWSVPSNVELKTFPRSIVDRSGTLGSCRYFVVDGQVALVNPDQHEVVLLIDRK